MKRAVPSSSQAFVGIYQTARRRHNPEDSDHGYVIWSNKMHTLYISVSIKLYCLRHVSSNQVFILTKTSTCNVTVFFHVSVRAVWLTSGCVWYLYGKVSIPITGPDRPWGFREVEAPTCPISTWRW